MTSKYQIKCSCILCKLETTSGQLTRNHSTKCPIKPAAVRFPKNFGRDAWNKGLIGDLRCSRKGVNRGSKINEERKQHLSVLAKARGFGGYNANAGRSKKFKVFDSYGNQTTLQSSYEHDCFEILAELGINWIRPKALKYNGKNYFADFYLVDFDIWLDPKNDYKAKQDEAKIQQVIKENKVRLIVLSKKQITKEYIASII